MPAALLTPQILSVYCVMFRPRHPLYAVTVGAKLVAFGIKFKMCHSTALAAYPSIGNEEMTNMACCVYLADEARRWVKFRESSGQRFKLVDYREGADEDCTRV